MERKTEKEIKNGEMKKKKSEATPPPAPRRRFHYASLTSQRRQIQIKNKESESLPMFPLDGTTSAALPPPQHSPWLRLQHESSQFLLPLRCLRGGGACEDACEDACEIEWDRIDLSYWFDGLWKMLGDSFKILGDSFKDSLPILVDSWEFEGFL